MAIEDVDTVGVPVDQDRIAGAMQTIIAAIGEDGAREGLVDTPERVARMYAEVFAGLREDPVEVLQTGFAEGYDEMIVARGITFFSMCEHHFLPFFGVIHIGYIPQGRVVGISKLARVVDVLARRPQLQERLTQQIADALMEGIRPQGAGVVVEAEHLCYDRETEVLTPDGWVRFDQLPQGIPVAQVDVSDLTMSFAVPSAYVRYRYSGEMVGWRSKMISLLVTPDHRMVYHPEWDFNHGRRYGWRLAAASSLPGRFYVPTAAYWRAPATGRVSLGGRVIEADEYARFMAAWLAEGCTRTSLRDVVISQDAGAFADELWRLLQRLPFGFRRVPQVNRPPHIQFKSSNRALYRELSRFGRSGDRFIPETIKAMAPGQIATFLDWFERGDGHRYAHNPLRVQYVSKSAQLVDDLQDLLVRIGRAGAIQRYANCARLETRTMRKAGSGYKWYARLAPKHRYEVDFDDDVFCVTVPTGALLVRREGRTIVSGNCMMMRGVKKPDSRIVTSVNRGCFRTDPRTRAEFLGFAGQH